MSITTENRSDIELIQSLVEQGGYSERQFIGQTPEGYNGEKWNGKYGFVTLTAYGQPYGPDGL